MNKLIKVGVVGGGDSDPGLIRNFRTLSGWDLKMLCEASPARLRALTGVYPGVAGAKNFEHMLNGIGLDAVVVATPLKMRFAMARAALLAGKHVMIKKPMASSAAECEELIDIARRNGLVLMIGDPFLYSPAVKKIKEVIVQGLLGDIRHICARRQDLGPCQKDINVAWDLAPHDVSIALHLMDKLPAIVSCCGTAHLTRGVEDVTSLSLQFGRNCTAIIHSSWLDPRKVQEMTIVGTKKMIVYDEAAMQEKIKIYDTRVEISVDESNAAQRRYTYHHGDISMPCLQQEEPLKQECLHFLECIQELKTPSHCGRRGLELVRILEASSASLKLKGSAIPMGRSQSIPQAKAMISKRKKIIFPQLISTRVGEPATVAPLALPLA